jgi:O-antigen/teichoic acid export membrane protein
MKHSMTPDPSDTAPAASATAAPAAPPKASTRQALVFVYAGYFVRYIYLLILIPLYGRVLGPETYGKVLAAMSLYNVVWLITNYGFSPVGVRAVASASDDRSVAALFGRHVSGRALTMLAGIAVGVGGVLMSPVLRAEPLYGVLATVMGIVQAYNLGWLFQGLHRFRTSIILEVIGFGLSLALILSLVHSPADGLWVMASLLASALITGGASYVIALKGLDRAAIRFDGALPLIKEAATLFFLGGIAQLVINASSYVLSLFADAQNVGYFGSAERLAGIVLSLMIPANQVLIAVVSQRVGSQRGDGDAGFGLMRKAMLCMLAFGVVSMVLVIGLAPFAVPLVLGEEFRATVPLLQTLALLYPFAAFTQVATLYVLIPLRKDMLAMKVTAVGTVLHFGALVLFSWLYDGAGAAAARLMGEALTACLLGVTLWRLGLLSRLWRPDAAATASR